jgi:hypothetical protein
MFIVGHLPSIASVNGSKTRQVTEVMEFFNFPPPSELVAASEKEKEEV